MAKIGCMKRIIINPDVCNGQPVLEGTRITARTVLEFLAAGDTIEDVLEEYPSLLREMMCLSVWRFSANAAMR